MKPFRLSRRAVLRAGGGVAIALPWLEIMEPERASHAAPEPAPARFVAVYTPGGTVLDAWRPSGSAQSFTLGPILTPLAGMQKYLTVVQGLELSCALGKQGEAGMLAWLTGCAQQRTTGLPHGSIDQVLAEQRQCRVLYQAVRWATGSGRQDASNVSSYAAGGSAEQLPATLPWVNPAKTWSDLFGALPSYSDAAWRKSMLDVVVGRYARLSSRLGSRDRAVLERHMDQLRQLELGLKEHCQPPALVDTSDYDPFLGAGSSAVTDAAIPNVGKFMIDLLVMALSCDITSVAVLQWADARAAYTLPWLGLPGNQTQSFYENGGGYDVASLTKIFTWYSTQHAYLLERLQQTEAEGGTSLLEQTVVFFGSHQQNPATHAHDDMPFLLAGGGIAGNRNLTFTGRAHNDLLVSLLNKCGDERQSFGDAGYSSGPLPGL